MKFKLFKHGKISGAKATFYLVMIDGGKSSFGEFINENIEKHEKMLMEMMGRLKNMGNINGATDNFFKLNESSRGDERVVAFYDIPDKNFRVYCVKLSDQIVVLGGGGQKPWYHFRWQDNPKLKKEAELIESISYLIGLKLNQSKLHISEDGLSLIGDLELN